MVDGVERHIFLLTAQSMTTYVDNMVFETVCMMPL